MPSAGIARTARLCGAKQEVCHGKGPALMLYLTVCKCFLYTEPDWIVSRWKRRGRAVQRMNAGVSIWDRGRTQGRRRSGGDPQCREKGNRGRLRREKRSDVFLACLILTGRQGEHDGSRRTEVFFVGLAQGVSVFNDMFGIHTFPHKKAP